MPPKIHPTALVDKKAELGTDVTIGPFCIIGPHAQIGDNVTIHERSSVDWARIGKGSHIGANTLIGGDPQIYNWPNVESWVEIGAEVTINELTAVHRSMYKDMATRIGNGSYIMTQVHIGHDCLIGKEVTITTLAGLSGHVQADDFSVIGGAVGIHQFVRIGTMAMVGGMTRLAQDVAPFFTVEGNPGIARGLNSYALKKQNVPRDERAALRKAYHLLKPKGSKPNMSETCDKIEAELGEFVQVQRLVAFIRACKRGITL